MTIAGHRALPDVVGDPETRTRLAVQALTRVSLTYPPLHRAL